MMFVDQARIFIKAGDGGKGCESFYSDKFTRYPRPDGGDGGKGGNVIFLSSENIQTLLDYRFKQHYEAKRGGHGGSKGKKGKIGQDLILKIPVGTLVWDHATGLLIKDFTKAEQSVIVAKAGVGGHGNVRNRTPTPPGQGEQRTVRLELKLIADVGLIGFPNVGKSTLISSVSKVKSKIAHYPFTTKQPILGIVQGEDFDFIMADLPGLIEGAHQGRGLGDRFLKHAERTKMLLHVIDMAGSEGRDPLDDYEKINHELKEYSEDLFFKIKIIVANKMDLPDAQANLKKFKRKYKAAVIPISAKDKTGLQDLMEHVREILCQEHFLGR